MGLVTDALVELLRKQVETHSTVVWFDPEGTYLDVAHSLTPEVVADAVVHRYEPERGFFWLRRQIEPIWGEASAPPRLILYVPLAQGETHHALIEFEVAGAVMQPGQQPPERNTALAAVARRALEPIRPAAALEQIVGEVEAGKWSLAELDREAERSVEEQAGVLKVVFNTGNASEISLRFVSDPAIDAQVEAKQARESLASLLGDTLGVPFSVDQGCTGLRAQLARQVLVTDLVQALGDDLPQSLRTFAVASQVAARQAAAGLAQIWRNRRDLSDSYVSWANQVQTEIGLSWLDVGLNALSRVETFRTGEVHLQQMVETALAQHTHAPLVNLAQQRLGGFWSAHSPEVKTRWQVIIAAGRVLLEAARVEKALKGKSWSASALLSRYAAAVSPADESAGEDDRPWCDLDTAQRHLERDFHGFEVDPQRHESLIQLVSLARQHYAAVADRLAELFTHAYAEAHFELPGIRQQADIYHQAVAPAAQQGPVAYILVDALRFEMARDLLPLLDEAWVHELNPALATPPTITDIGMAALLPGAENGLTVTLAGNNKLAPVIAGQTLKTRQERLDHFVKAVAQGKEGIVTARLEQLAPLSDARLGRDIQKARLTLATATEEIDGLCESNPNLARRMLDDVLNQLRRGIKTLFGMGVGTVVISADHGYLFGQKLSTGQKIDAPGGQTAVLKRRVWVGQGGAHSPATLRAPLSAFGLSSELELASPWSLSCFKAQGGDEYFHGGLSLQELVVPVLVVQVGAPPAPAAAAQVQWTLTLGSRTISTRFLSVTIEGQSAELLPLEPPAVRVEVRADDQPISVPVSASYGFQETTKDVQLALDVDAREAIARNTVTLMIAETPPVEAVTVHLLDATTGIGLARLDQVPFAITL